MVNSTASNRLIVEERWLRDARWIQEIVPLHLGRYLEDERTIHLFLDGLRELRGNEPLSAKGTRDLIRLALVHMLVHAADAQEGRFPGLGGGNNYYVLRALREGHAEWVTQEITTQLGEVDTTALRLWKSTQGQRLQVCHRSC